jgi:hypothetical protein
MVSTRMPASGDRAGCLKEHEVRRRLRTLLELAISIGRREGLLGGTTNLGEEIDDSGDRGSTPEV